MATNRKLRQHRLQLASCSQCKLKLHVGCTILCAPHYVHHIVCTPWCTLHYLASHIVCTTWCTLQYLALHIVCTTLHVVHTAMHIGSLGAHNRLAAQGADARIGTVNKQCKFQEIYIVYLCAMSTLHRFQTEGS